MADGTGLLTKRFDSDQYQWEKIIGKRRPTGALKLKRLNGRQRTIIALHLRGLSGRDISEIMGMDEVSISRILNDPLSAEYINAYFNGVDIEIRALLTDAVEAVRQSLTSEKHRERLDAADKVFKLTGKYKKEGADDDKTSEDVVAEMLSIMKDQSSTVKDLVNERKLQNVIDVTPIDRPSVKLIENEE